MTAILLAIVAAAQWAWSWLAPVVWGVGGVAAELLLKRLWRRRRRAERRAVRGRGRHRVG